MSTANHPPTTDNTQDAMNTALEDLKDLVRDAEEVLANAGENAEEQVSELHDRLRHALGRSRAKLRDLQSAAQDHLQEYDEYVRSHPYQSIGAAVALGAILGLLLGRRSS